MNIHILKSLLMLSTTLLLTFSIISCSEDNEVIDFSNIGTQFNEAGLPIDIPNNMIVYKSTDGKLILGNPKTGSWFYFGEARIKSHIYSEEKGYGIITFWDDVTYIDIYNSDCLEGITIPSSAIDISCSFCKNLSWIVVEDENSIYDSRENCNAIIETATNKLIVGCKNTVIPPSIVSIGNFNSAPPCITIPASVMEIRLGAFEGCKGIDKIIVDKNNPIYDSREDCNAIIETARNRLIVASNNTIVPSSVTEIDTWAYRYNDFDKIVVNSNNPVFDSRENCNAIIETATNKLISGCKNTVIPSSVTDIENFAFHACHNLTYIFIPASVSYVRSAFYACHNLKQIVVDADNPIYDSRENCNAIIETSTNTLVAGCQNTRIPSSVRNIGEAAFDGNISYGDIIIPDGVTNIENHAFAYCVGCTSITIPSSVKTIGRYAFYFSSDPDAGINIQNFCLSEISVHALIPPSADKYSIDNLCYGRTVLKVPASSKSLYETTEPWSRFEKIEAI